MNSLCRALSRVASSQSTTRRLLPPSILLLQHSSYSSTSTKKKRDPKTTTTLSKKKWSSSLDWPRPMEIPFQAKVANSVNLIGYVNMPIEYQVSADGTHWAATVISQDQPFHQSPSLWIPIIFEGDLAHIAVSHLKKGDHVYVAGQLSGDPRPLDVLQGQAQVQVQVMVHSINFVQESFQMKKNLLNPQKEEEPLEDSVAYAEQSWKDLLVKPHEWWDIRSGDKSTGAAFERKDNGELLWIGNSTPKWIQQKLEVMTFDCKTRVQGGKTSLKKDGGCTSNSWRDLLDNPKQWWDYRSDKVNPKFPDFKHKDSGLSLWLNRAPMWVLLELEGVEFDVKSPKTDKKKGDDSWKDLVENPSKWWDNRLSKKNVKAPDFKHKETGEVLWLDNSPAWVLPKLP